MLKPIIVQNVDEASYLMMDDSPIYPGIGREFAGHGSVNHSAEEYVWAHFWHTNTVENCFSVFKRGVFGCYCHVSEAHLHRYAAEFDFWHNHHSNSGYRTAEGTYSALGAQSDTIRLNLIKVAARVTEMVTRIKVALPSAYPYRAGFTMLAGQLAKLPP